MSFITTRRGLFAGGAALTLALAAGCGNHEKEIRQISQPYTSLQGRLDTLFREEDSRKWVFKSIDEYDFPVFGSIAPTDSREAALHAALLRVLPYFGGFFANFDQGGFICSTDVNEPTFFGSGIAVRDSSGSEALVSVGHVIDYGTRGSVSTSNLFFRPFMVPQFSPSSFQASALNPQNFVSTQTYGVNGEYSNGSILERDRAVLARERNLIHTIYRNLLGLPQQFAINPPEIFYGELYELSKNTNLALLGLNIRVGQHTLGQPYLQAVEYSDWSDIFLNHYAPKTDKPHAWGVETPDIVKECFGSSGNSGGPLLIVDIDAFKRGLDNFVKVAGVLCTVNLPGKSGKCNGDIGVYIPLNTLKVNALERAFNRASFFQPFRELLSN